MDTYYLGVFGEILLIIGLYWRFFQKESINRREQLTRRRAAQKFLKKIALEERREALRIQEQKRNSERRRSELIYILENGLDDQI